MSNGITLESLLTEFSALLNCVLEQGCIIAAQLNDSAVRIEFGIRETRSENRVCFVPVHALRLPDQQLVENCDSFAAVELLKALGLNAEFDSGCILVTHDGEIFELSLITQIEEMQT